MGRFTTTLADKGLLLFDGAMGTQLLARGPAPGQCLDELNLSQPEMVAGVHADYAAAGCDVVTANSFGCSPHKLAPYGLAEQTEELNRAAARLARQAAPDCLIAGDVGPTGQLLPPLGQADPEEIKLGYIRQITGLVEGGVDLIMAETFTELTELGLMVEAAREVDSGIELAATLTFNPTPRGFYSMMGVSLAQAAEMLAEAEVAALGSNCGNGSEQMAALTEALSQMTDLPIIIQANAGLPRFEEGQTIYDHSCPRQRFPEIMIKEALQEA